MVRIGGTFLTSTDPHGLADWLSARFDIKMERQDEGDMLVIQAEGGFSVLATQPAKDAPAIPEAPVVEEPYGRQNVLVNLAVEDLDAIVKRLNDAGDPVQGPKDYGEFGRFAWTRTPDGHDLELWQPK